MADNESKKTNSLLALLSSPWALRVIGLLVGTALGASCPLWPAKVQPICVAVADEIKRLVSNNSPPASKLPVSSNSDGS